MLINLEFYHVWPLCDDIPVRWSKGTFALEADWAMVVAEGWIEIRIKNKKVIFYYYENYENFGKNGFWLDRSKSDLELIDWENDFAYLLVSKITTSNGVIFEDKEKLPEGLDIRE